MRGKRILLIIGGGIAAYKCLELIRLIRKAGGAVSPVLTRAGSQFVTPLAVAAGTDVIVTASALFGSDDRARVIQVMKAAGA